MSDTSFQLMTESGQLLENPTQEVVLEILRAMAQGDEEFVIMERVGRGDEGYIQTTLNPGGGIIVEYRDSPESDHYRLVADDVQKVHDIFSWWVVEEPGWRDGLPWQLVET